jgi:hypothetical protein
MSNIFKPNSRFSVLVENNSTDKEFKKNSKADKVKNKEENVKNKEENVKNKEENVKNNSFKDNNNLFKGDSSRNRRHNEDNRGRNQYTNKYSKEQKEQIEREEILRKEEQERIKEENFIRSMAAENFPDLVARKIEKKVEINYVSFLDKLKTAVNNECETNFEDPDLKDLKPGWCIIKRDPLTKQIITKIKESNDPILREKSEKEIGIDILCALSDLHKRRTEEYIDLWGYDTWEKTFRSPTWDYEYFDKLDEAYEEEMKILEEEQEEEENKEY